MKAKKAPGIDGVGGLFFKIASDSLCHILALIFSMIMRTGIFPKSWTRLILCPIYKNKGSVTDPKNYRGIALLPVVGKIFTSILNKRLIRWAENGKKIDDRQAGFRRGYSTLDNIFILDTLMASYKKKKVTLYMAFVDYRDAFNKVSRNALMFKLNKMGVSSQFTKVLESMYSQGSFSVKISSEKVTESRPYTTGCYQGDNLSPTLFSLFVNDIFPCLESVDGWPPNLDGKPVTGLLYADDLVLLSTSVLGLQRQLNELERYADYWGMEVNVNKTNTFVSKKGHVLKRCEKWTYKNEKIATVSSFKYLGVHLNHDNSWTHHLTSAEAIGKRASRALSPFFHKFSTLPVSSFLKIFDAAVVPSVLYGAEIWGAGVERDGINRAASLFYRILLGLPQSAPVSGLHLELGRQRLTEAASLRAISYWLRLSVVKEDRLLHSAFKTQIALAEKGADCWASRVKLSLDRLGFSVAWSLPPAPDCHTMFISSVKRRTFDQSFSKNLEIANKLPSLKNYVINRTAFGMEKIL